jgi:hypothetical protein
MFGILQTHKSPAKSKAGNCWNVQGLAAPYGAHGNATVWNVAGGRIVRLQADGADIQSADGQSRTFRRRRVTTSWVTLPWSS